MIETFQKLSETGILKLLVRIWKRKTNQEMRTTPKRSREDRTNEDNIRIELKYFFLVYNTRLMFLYSVYE